MFWWCSSILNDGTFTGTHLVGPYTLQVAYSVEILFYLQNGAKDKRIGILSEIGHDLLWYTTLRKILFGDDTPRHLQSVFISYMYTWHASLNYMALHECTCIKNIIDIRELTSQKVVQGWVVFSLDEGSQLG